MLRCKIWTAKKASKSSEVRCTEVSIMSSAGPSSRLSFQIHVRQGLDLRCLHWSKSLTACLAHEIVVSGRALFIVALEGAVSKWDIGVSKNTAVEGRWSPTCQRPLATDLQCTVAQWSSNTSHCREGNQEHATHLSACGAHGIMNFDHHDASCESLSLSLSFPFLSSLAFLSAAQQTFATPCNRPLCGIGLYHVHWSYHRVAKTCTRQSRE